MRDWPSGFWQARPYEWMCFVVSDELWADRVLTAQPLDDVFA